MYRDQANKTISNWLRYINCPNYEHEENLIAEEFDEEIYFRTVHKIPAGKFTTFEFPSKTTSDENKHQ